MITRLFYLFIFIGFSGLLYPQAISQHQSLDQCFELVRERFSGDNAFQTTKYVAEKWRLPGNPGFDSSIFYVQKILEKAGYQNETVAPNSLLTYRIERHPLRLPAWHPVNATLSILGEDEPLLQFKTNRNMIAINSFATPSSGLEAELVYVDGCEKADFNGINLKGKIVMADCHSYPLFKRAIEESGALGILSYRIPDFNQPDKHPNSIPFRSIPFNSEHKAWGINLSATAKKALLAKLKLGKVHLKINIETEFIPSEELVLIAEVKGQKQPEQRFVFSAHVQEPGANDNASGVGAQTEMARVAAQLVNERTLLPDRTITFIWGDEIRATRRYLEENNKRTKNVLWGMSLDMVGEDTEKTGGSFLIEKMPDPSAIWTRGDDKHTEWGATEVSKSDLNPHYFNDYIIYVCKQQGKHANWTVNTNPFEGGSDHQPFLDAGLPGLLLWHFTDVFYHTDADRIDKVSASTLQNVGISALVSALYLNQISNKNAQMILEIIQEQAFIRLEKEWQLSNKAIQMGKKVAEEKVIIQTWAEWYTQALEKIVEIPGQAPNSNLEKRIRSASQKIQFKAAEYIKQLRE